MIDCNKDEVAYSDFIRYGCTLLLLYFLEVLWKGKPIGSAIFDSITISEIELKPQIQIMKAFLFKDAYRGRLGYTESVGYPGPSGWESDNTE